VNEIEWLRNNGRIEERAGRKLFVLDSPLKRKLDADEKRLKQYAVRWLQKAGAMYDFDDEQWMLLPRWNPTAFQVLAEAAGEGK